MAGTEGPIMETLASRGRTPELGHKKGAWVLENQSMKVRTAPVSKPSALSSSFMMSYLNPGMAPDQRGQIQGCASS